MTDAHPAPSEPEATVVEGCDCHDEAHPWVRPAPSDLATLLAEHSVSTSTFNACSCGLWFNVYQGDGPFDIQHSAHLAEVIKAAGWRQVPEVMQDVRVEVEHRLNEPTACKVWRSGALVFDGVDKSAGADR